MQGEVENATWNLLASCPFEFQLNLGKSDPSLEYSLFCGEDLSSAVRNLVSDAQLSPIHNRIGDGRVFEKCWTQKRLAVVFSKCALGPAAFPGVLYKYKGVLNAHTQRGLIVGSSSAASRGHDQREICSVGHWLPLLHLQSSYWLWGVKQKCFECRAETGELFPSSSSTLV